jgi:hypothetical protein
LEWSWIIINAPEAEGHLSIYWLANTSNGYTELIVITVAIAELISTAATVNNAIIILILKSIVN